MAKQFSTSNVCQHLSAKTGIRALIFICISISVSACLPVKKPQPLPPPAPVVEVAPQPSTAPIKDAPKNQIVFAQTALTKLGYRLGGVDGIWGPRSAQAMQQFEAENNLITAGGFLSEANLASLTVRSGLTEQSVIASRKAPQKPKKVGLEAKITEKVDESKPQLVIVEQNYTVYTKPNPFSAVLMELEPGTGVYVLSRNEDWLTVENMSREKGYIHLD